MKAYRFLSSYRSVRGLRSGEVKVSTVAILRGRRVGMKERTDIVRREVDYRLSYAQRGERDAEPDDDEETRRAEGFDEGHFGASFLSLPSSVPNSVEAWELQHHNEPIRGNAYRFSR